MGRKHNVDDRTGEAFEVIKDFWGRTGMSPSLREVGREMGITSSSLIRFYVEKLEKAGKIRRNGNKSRNILLIPQKPSIPALARRREVQLAPTVLDIPNYGPIAAGIPLHLPDVSFKKGRRNHLEQTVVHVPESYLPAGVKAEDVFALHVEGDSMRDAMLTDGDVVILQKTSIDKVKNGDIVAAWIIDTQETTLKRFQKTKRGISLRPENPEYKTLYFQPDEVDIQGKLLAVLRFRY